MGRSVGTLRDGQAVGAILSWAGEVWRLLTCLTCLEKRKKKRRWGDEIAWMTRDQFRFDMGVNRRRLMSEIFVFIGRWEFGNFADGGWGSSLSSVYWIPLVLR